MTLYMAALFAHIVGAILLFAVLTVEGLSFRLSFSVAAYNRVIGPVSGLLVLVPGLYMARVQWGFAPWILFGLGAWLVIAVLGAATGILVMRRGNRPGRLALVSWLGRSALAFLVVADMVVKP